MLAQRLKNFVWSFCFHAVEKKDVLCCCDVKMEHTRSVTYRFFLNSSIAIEFLWPLWVGTHSDDNFIYSQSDWCKYRYRHLIAALWHEHFRLLIDECRKLYIFFVLEFPLEQLSDDKNMKFGPFYTYDFFSIKRTNTIWIDLLCCGGRGRHKKISLIDNKMMKTEE